MMTKKQDILERYLLGDISEEERSEIEQAYFADDAFFEQLIDVRNDLVDAYARGMLSAEDRKRFEERLLTTESGSDRVGFARALQQKIAARSARKTGDSRFFAIAASLLIVVIAAGWMMLTLKGRPQPPIAKSQPKVTPQQQTTSSVPVPVPNPLIATVLLTPGGTRESEAAPPLVLRPAPQFVRVELVLEDDRYDSYAAELQDVEGRALWRGEPLQAVKGPSGKTVAVSVPAKLLPPGDYIVVLQGIRAGKSSEINNYTFTVVALPARR